MIDLKKLFRKEQEEKLTDLEKAWKLNLITEEEFLILKEKRATEECKKFYDRAKKK